jgi:HSP20 family protein
MRSLEKTNRERHLNDPFRSFFDIENFWPSFQSSRNSPLPAVNVSEDEKNYNIEVAAPGFKKEDFRLNVDDDVLTISAEHKTETPESDGKQYSRREYSYSSFTRSFRLPDNVKDDAIRANYTDGVLKLELPKSKEQVKATKEIRIS